ncbi:MAG: hypothetical protein ABI704_00650 [Kofleriaceae bacterium]
MIKIDETKDGEAVATIELLPGRIVFAVGDLELPITFRISRAA